MVHVGGNYNKKRYQQGICVRRGFGVCNNYSNTNQSNSESNRVLKTIQKQANKSKRNLGYIRVIIEKRIGNEYPKNKKIKFYFNDYNFINCVIKL